MTAPRRLAVLAVALLALTGCTGPSNGFSKDATDTDPAPTTAAASPTPSRSPSPATSIAVTVSADQQACDLNLAMQKRHTALDYTSEGDTINKIVQLAGNSTNFDIRTSANMLKDRYDLAKASGELSDIIELGSASINLRTACIKAGLDSDV